jgi:CBS domain containing-hemolysin-like protein
MLMYDFSQLPVMQNERDVDGIISWRSIINAQIVNGTANIVRDCLISEVSIVPYDAPLFNAVKIILEQEFVLVRSSDKKITGLVTVTDIGEQFIALAEPFLVLEQIENHIRGWLDGCFTLDQLKATLDPSDTNREVEAISDLTFGEYVRLLEKPEHWQTLNLSLDRATFTKRLDEVRQIRNDVMHFDPDGISKTDLDTLRETSQFFYVISQFKK